jgi:hypothetical protein
MHPPAVAARHFIEPSDANLALENHFGLVVVSHNVRAVFVGCGVVVVVAEMALFGLESLLGAFAASALGQFDAVEGHFFGGSVLVVLPAGRGHVGKVKVVLPHVKGLFVEGSVVVGGGRRGSPGRSRRLGGSKRVGKAPLCFSAGALDGPGVQIPQQVKGRVDQAKGFRRAALVRVMEQARLVVELAEYFEFLVARVAVGKDGVAVLLGCNAQIHEALLDGVAPLLGRRGWRHGACVRSTRATAARQGRVVVVVVC